MSEPIRVFVGAAPNGEDAESQMVLEYSLRLNCSKSVEITWMQMSHDPSSPWFVGEETGWNTTQWATPFSGFRWGIPETCDYKGRAIYMDSDMMILGDLAELIDIDLEGKVAAVKRSDRFCVTVWDCSAVGQLVDGGYIHRTSVVRHVPSYHHAMMGFYHSNPHILKIFDRQWNNFDGENDPLSDIKILHYTDMSTQPHAKYALPRLEKEGKNHWFDGTVRQHRRQDVVELFDYLYTIAKEAGYTVEQYIPKQPFGPYSKQTQKGYVSNNGFDVTKGE